MKISVIVPCRNEKRHIREFLDSVLRQELEPDWQIEVLVADGMSDDGTRSILQHYGEIAPAVRMIENPEGIVSTGLNAAIRAATGDFIVRMDVHTVYATDYIRHCIAVTRETGADNVGGPWVAAGRGWAGRAIAAAFQSPFCMGGGRSHDANYEGEVDTVYLGCWKPSLFDRIGVFDPELVRNQDDELNFRLRQAGGRLWQSPRIRSLYTPRDSIAALFRQYCQYGFWKVAVIRKHRALAAWRHLVPPAFVSLVLLLPAAALAARLLGAPVVAGNLAAILAAILALYAFFCCVAAAPFTGKLDWPALLMLPAVVATYHTAYGLGFLSGALSGFLPRAGNARPSRFFNAITRN